jgi:hypothetical protein
VLARPGVTFLLRVDVALVLVSGYMYLCMSFAGLHVVPNVVTCWC